MPQKSGESVAWRGTPLGMVPRRTATVPSVPLETAQAVSKRAEKMEMAVAPIRGEGSPTVISGIKSAEQEKRQQLRKTLYGRPAGILPQAVQDSQPIAAKDSFIAGIRPKISYKEDPGVAYDSSGIQELESVEDEFPKTDYANPNVIHEVADTTVDSAIKRPASSKRRAGIFGWGPGIQKIMRPDLQLFVIR